MKNGEACSEASPFLFVLCELIAKGHNPASRLACGKPNRCQLREATMGV